MSKSIEQLKADAAAAAEALKQAEQEEQSARLRAAQAERDAKVKRENEEKRKQYAAIGEALVEGLRANGFPKASSVQAEGSSLYPAIMLFGEKKSYGELSVEIEAHYMGYYRSGVKITVGTYGADRKSYRQRQDGTFNYAAIAKELLERSNAQIARAEREKKGRDARSEADARAAELNKKLGLQNASSVIIGSYETNRYNWDRRFVTDVNIAEKDKVIFRPGALNVTPEQATILVDAMRAAGLIKGRRHASMAALKLAYAKLTDKAAREEIGALLRELGEEA